MASTRRARSTMRESRWLKTERVVPTAVRRKTGAMASWMVWVMSVSSGSVFSVYSK